MRRMGQGDEGRGGEAEGGRGRLKRHDEKKYGVAAATVRYERKRAEQKGNPR